MFQKRNKPDGTVEAVPLEDDEPPLSGKSCVDIITQLSNIYPQYTIRESKSRFVVVDFFVGAFG
jgi:hypothetical protein